MYSYWFVNDDVHRLATKAIRNSAYLRNNKKQDDLVPSKSRAIVSENADIDKKFWLVIRQSESENGQVELSIDSVLNSYDDALSYARGL